LAKCEDSLVNDIRKTEYTNQYTVKAVYKGH